jgi:hypothetical protein
MTTLPLRRTQSTVVERMRGRVSDAWVAEACSWGFCPENKEAALTAGWEDDLLNMLYISISQLAAAFGPGPSATDAVPGGGICRKRRG